MFLQYSTQFSYTHTDTHTKNNHLVFPICIVILRHPSLRVYMICWLERNIYYITYYYIELINKFYLWSTAGIDPGTFITKIRVTCHETTEPNKVNRRFLLYKFLTKSRFSPATIYSNTRGLEQQLSTSHESLHINEYVIDSLIRAVSLSRSLRCNTCLTNAPICKHH